jgi:hypothetical protein
MNHYLRILSFLLVTIYSSLPAAHGQTLPKRLTWQLKPLSSIKTNGITLSKTGLSTAGWVTAIVPGTAFYAYVRAGKESILCRQHIPS